MRKLEHPARTSRRKENPNHPSAVVRATKLLSHLPPVPTGYGSEPRGAYELRCRFERMQARKSAARDPYMIAAIGKELP